MRHLYLMRHASADPRAVFGGDRNRPLSAIGKEQLRRARDFFTDVPLTMVMCSSAMRTRQTAEGIGSAAPLHYEPSFYTDTYQAILDRVYALDDAQTDVLVVAHSPGIPTLVRQLADAESDPVALESVAHYYPPATMAKFEVAVPWSQLRQASLVLAIRF